ncbi:MAG TPA: hypothetical protein VFV33_01960, partial [Gemmatimonadaceae bacterium]|nr:hypothetical protein [Gemmatimonadaceae bacterium]
DQGTRMPAPITSTLSKGTRRNTGDGRVRQALGRVQAQRDGEYLVRLVTTPPAPAESTDSFYVSRAASARELSRPIGLMALGGALFLVILALGGMIGRAVLDRDAA